MLAPVFLLVLGKLDGDLFFIVTNNKKMYEVLSYFVAHILLFPLPILRLQCETS
jgi:hypothetical protein